MPNQAPASRASKMIAATPQASHGFSGVTTEGFPSRLGRWGGHQPPGHIPQRYFLRPAKVTGHGPHEAAVKYAAGKLIPCSFSIARRKRVAMRVAAEISFRVRRAFPVRA